MNHIYPNCIPVMGASNIAFYDLEKQQFRRFNKNELFNENDLKNLQTFDINKVHENGITLLQKQELLFPPDNTSHVEFLGPSFFYKWMHPSLITNAIVELSEHNGLLEKDGFEKLLLFLEKLLCKHISLKINDWIGTEHFFLLVKTLHEAAIHSVQFIISYKEEWDTEEVGNFIMNQPKIKWVIFESAHVKRNLENKIFFFDHALKPSGKKQLQQFIVNVFMFSESQLHHNYFNRKLFIGSAGEIKNAPECDEVFGWIQDMKQPHQLIELIKTAVFQKYWYVTKDRCEICKDCEFRYMCMDNRIPHLHENGYWYHREECNYDPYLGVWKE